MKKLINLSIALVAFFSFAEAKMMATGNTELLAFDPGESKVEVYYFHYTRRCATCNAVEDETLKAIEKNFADQMKNGNITFLSVNIEDKNNASLMEDLNVSGQSLIFVNGDKKIDITNDAFMNARTKTEKFHNQVKKTIKELME
jgi:hypothetical protein